MPVIYGTVGGRCRNGLLRDAMGRPGIQRACRHWVPFDEWERQLVIEWTQRGIGVEEMARRLMRPVAQIVGFDPVRPNGRRSDG